jgi:hypothetical protein
MEGRKKLPQVPHLTGLSHINEPELDMRRYGRVERGRLRQAFDLIRKLAADSRGMVSPMRSIAREMEESWPTGE